MNELPEFGSGASDGAAHEDLGESWPVDPADDLLGATDIVEAFTALRHELKLQVRSGHELQQTLVESLRRVEQRIASPQRQDSLAALSDEPRQLAETVVELEERLDRAVEAISEPENLAGQEARLLDQFDSAVLRASWGARTFAAGLLREVRVLIEQAACDLSELEIMLDSTRQGLALMNERVRQLMKKCDIERVDVLHQPFDAEVMHAIDVIAEPSLPSSHVAEQIRPAYFWHGSVLCYASVRLAR